MPHLHLQLSSAFQTDYQEVLTETISSFLRARGPRRLLDIGAGPGGVAVALARQVSRYLAVEEDPASCERLRAAGLQVQEATFPTAVPGQFDMVVASHSIPNGEVSDYEPFLGTAWNLVAPSGLLLIATFKGAEEQPIAAFSTELFGRRYGLDPRYAEMLRILGHLGEPILSRAISYSVTSEFSDIEALFGSWFWENEDEAKERRPLLREAFAAKFMASGQYRVPRHHQIVAMYKPAAPSP